MIESIHHHMPALIFIGMAIFIATSRDGAVADTNHTQQQE